MQRTVASFFKNAVVSSLSLAFQGDWGQVDSWSAWNVDLVLSPCFFWASHARQAKFPHVIMFEK
jgi:hypothetical protein